MRPCNNAHVFYYGISHQITFDNLHTVDGYDYPFQVRYKEKWDQLVTAFQECCDAFPDIKWSLEFKPTDENTRFFTVPSTGAALLLVKDIDRPNMGLTLDVGHMLMAGEVSLKLCFYIYFALRSCN